MEFQYREALYLSRAEYEIGKVDLLSVLVIQGQWIGSKIELINTQDQRLLQRVDLHLALGGVLLSSKGKRGLMSQC
jgi:outer membrane protein TolC